MPGTDNNIPFDNVDKRWKVSIRLQRWRSSDNGVDDSSASYQSVFKYKFSCREWDLRCRVED